MDGPHILEFKKVKYLFSILLNVYVKISTVFFPLKIMVVNYYNNQIKVKISSQLFFFFRLGLILCQ